MRILNSLFSDKKIDYAKLVEYGFVKKGEFFVLEKKFCDDNFIAVVEISPNQQRAKVLDLQSNDEYVMADLKDAAGTFVGKIRSEYENILLDIIANCTQTEVFKAEQAKAVIKYITEKYADELEFLWPKFSKNAIWRNKTNKKWYAALLTIPQNRLGLNDDKIIEIIDLRYQKDKIAEIVDNQTIFPGYHMNKKSWITIKLDNSVDIAKIHELIDNSYNLSLLK